MAITLYPVAKETVRDAPWALAAAALDHGSDTSDPVYTVDKSITDANVIYRFNDSVIANGTETLADIPDLAFPISAREIWAFEYEIEYTRTGTCRLDIALVAPTGVQIYALAMGPDRTTPSGTIATRINALSATTTKLFFLFATGSLTDMPIRIVGVAIGVTAGGSIQVKFAKGNSVSGSISIQTQSTLLARKIIS